MMLIGLRDSNVSPTATSPSWPFVAGVAAMLGIAWWGMKRADHKNRRRRA